jgi:hypothetical protein
MVAPRSARLTRPRRGAKRPRPAPYWLGARSAGDGIDWVQPFTFHYTSCPSGSATQSWCNWCKVADLAADDSAVRGGGLNPSRRARDLKHLEALPVAVPVPTRAEDGRPWGAHGMENRIQARLDCLPPAPNVDEVTDMRLAELHEASPVLGLILILIAVAWLGENLHLEPGRLLGPLWPWPLLLIVLGVAAFTARTESSFPRGLALILGGVLVWASRAQLLPVPFWNILAPLLVGLVGGIVMWRTTRRGDAALPTSQRDPG